MFSETAHFARSFCFCVRRDDGTRGVDYVCGGLCLVGYLVDCSSVGGTAWAGVAGDSLRADWLGCVFCGSGPGSIWECGAAGGGGWGGVLWGADGGWGVGAGWCA